MHIKPDFFDCSDEEELPVHGAQELPKPPRLDQSSFESRVLFVSSSLFNPTSSISVHCKDYIVPTSVSSDRAAKLLGDSDAIKSNDTSSGSDKEEMEVQHRRRENFVKNTFTLLWWVMASYRPFSMLLSTSFYYSETY